MYRFIKHRVFHHIELGCQRKHCFRCWLGDRMVLADLKSSLRRCEQRIAKLKFLQVQGHYERHFGWYRVWRLDTPELRRLVRDKIREQEEMAATFRRALEFVP